MNEQEPHSNDYLRPPLWHGKFAFGKVSLRLTLQKHDASEKSTQRFQQVSLFALDEPFEEKSPIIRRRFLVLGLYFSFLACVTALWLTTNINTSLEYNLPLSIVNFIAAQPLVVLLVPLLLLIGCYLLLRLMTYELLAWPERFLDERQQIVRDKAHRNAYKIVKVARLLVPLYLCLHAVWWTAQPPETAPVPARTYTVVQPTEYLFEAVPRILIKGNEHVIDLEPALQLIAAQTSTPFSVSVSQNLIIDNSGAFTIDTKPLTEHPLSISFIVPMHPIYAIRTQEILSHEVPPSQPASIAPTPSWPNNPTSLLLYYGALLLTFFLMALALPMSLVAWKERL